MCQISVTLAQNTNNGFNFLVDKHDFGVIEEGTKATYTFEFINTGTDTIRLTPQNVKPGCGCTASAFTTEPIAPGQKGSITTVFDSQGRPGTFMKNVSVYYNDQLVKLLSFKGIVEKPETAVTYTEAQLKKSPKLVLEKTTVNFGKLERGQKGVYSIKVSNVGKDTLYIRNAQAACSCVTYKLLKEKTTEELTYILAGKSATLQITYSPMADGANRDVLTLTTNDLTKKRAVLTLESEVVESLQQNTIIQEDKTQIPFSH